MKPLRRSALVPVLLVGLTLLTVVLHEFGFLQFVEDIVLRVVSPVQSWFSDRAHGIKTVIDTLGDLGTLRAENTRLLEENNALVIENVQLKEAEAENERLRRLLDFARTNPTYDYSGGEVVARVIGRDPNIYLDYITIDQGKLHGIRSAMPVVTERGLVGRTTAVHDTTSEVLLITDVNSAVTALVQTSRATGVVRGQAGGGILLDQIAQGAQVNVGDIVITSGLGGNFPKGLVIGQVDRIYQNDHDMFQRAGLRPTVAFRDLEQVLVITNFLPLGGLLSVPEEAGFPGQ